MPLNLEMIAEINQKHNTNYQVINGVLLEPRFCVPGMLFYISQLGDFIVCSNILASNNEFIWPEGKFINEVTLDIINFWEEQNGKS